MKKRTKGFLQDKFISHDSVQFDYISELHEYLWRVIRVAFPDVSGRLCMYLDSAIEKLEAERMGDNNTTTRLNTYKSTESFINETFEDFRDAWNALAKRDRIMALTDKELELLPCPFCGAKAEYLLRSSADGGTYWFDVRCTNQGCYLEQGADWAWDDQYLAAQTWNNRQ